MRLDSRIGARERIGRTRFRGACGLDRRDWLPPDTFALDRGDPKQLARQALHSSLAKLYLCHSSATGARKSAIRPQRDRCIDYWTPLLHASDAQRSSPSGKSCSAVGLSRRLQLPADYPMAAQMQRRYYLRVQIFAHHRASRGNTWRAADHDLLTAVRPNSCRATPSSRSSPSWGSRTSARAPVKTVLHRSIPPHPTRRISPGTASATVVSRRCGVLRLRRFERGRRQREIPCH